MFPASQGPNYYLTTFPEYYGTYAIAPSTPYGPGPNDTANTPLPPFSTNAQGTFWTSASSQYLSTFGYTYPEIQDWNQTPSQLSSNVTAQVNMMYNPPTPSKRSLSPRSITTDGHEQVLEWSVGLSVSKFEMNGQRFIVRLFVGNIPEDPRTWATSESCAGSFAVLPPPQAPTGPVPDVKAYDEISLMQTLMSVGHDGKDVSAVVGYLKESFEWRVQLVCLFLLD
jgi:tyrosinase